MDIFVNERINKGKTTIAEKKRNKKHIITFDEQTMCFS